MIIPTSGIAFFFGAFVYIYLGRRFWRCYKAENNTVAKLFGYAFFLIGTYSLVIGIISLLLIKNQAIWRIIAPIYAFLLGGGYLIIGYTVGYIRFRKYLPFYITLLLVGLISIVTLYIIYPPSYFYTDGSLNWKINLPIMGLVIPIFVMMIIIPSIIIFFQEAKKAENKKVKIRSLGFGLALSAAFFGMISDFFLITVFGLHPIFSDLNYFIISLILLLTLVPTWTPLKKKLDETDRRVL